MQTWRGYLGGPLGPITKGMVRCGLHAMRCDALFTVVYYGGLGGIGGNCAYTRLPQRVLVIITIGYCIPVMGSHCGMSVLRNECR